MRLPDSAHTSRPWRIHELTPDFRLEDVWALPTPGGPDRFPRLVAQAASFDLSDGSSHAEIANRTVHGVLHLGWVPDETGAGWHGQLAVLVKRNGALGSAYMAAIAPFRHTIVYPQMMRRFAREWRVAGAR